MRPAPLIWLLLVVAALAAAAPSASAATATVDRNPRLWATVNICDTDDSPNAIGIRFSMPGSAVDGERMYAKVRVEYYRASEKRWRFLMGGTSRWIALGSAEYVRREGGRTFQLGAPSPGQEFRLRARVYYQWRLDGKVVRRAVKLTRTRPHGVTGSDPSDFAAAECRITTP